MAKQEDKKIDQRTASYGARSRGQTANYMPGPSVPIKGVGIQCGDVVIVTDPSSPFFDERAMEPIDGEMVDDVFNLGVHTPPIVCQRPGPGGKKLVCIVAGRQRFFVAHLANERRVALGMKPRVVECKLRNELTDAEIREIIISENEQRRADSLKNKISKANRLYKAEKERCSADGELFNATTVCKRLAMPFGVSAATFQRWLDVPGLADAARSAIFQGKVPLGQVDDLKKMTAADQATAVKAAVEAGATTPRRAREAAAEVPRVEEPPTQKRRPRAAIEAKLAELEAKSKQAEIPQAEDPQALMRRQAHMEALRYALGEDTL